MKLIYIANIRLPTEKAHGIQIMEMCVAFTGQGVSVELVIPQRKNILLDDPFVYHDVPRVFSIHKLPTLDFVRFGRVGFWISLMSFIISIAVYSVFKKDVIFYTRDEGVALSLRLLGKQVVWEGHTGQRNFLVQLLLRLQIPLVVITEALKTLYISMGATLSKIIVAPDGADITRFNIKTTQTEARNELGLPLDKKIALYKGHLYERKGAHTLARATTCLKEKNVICVFIGGTESDIESFKQEFGNLENVLILGNRPRKETPVYQRAADVLIIPNSAKDDVSKLYTSPMKLFGYMASGVPFIASDLPSLREIVNDTLAYFFTPDDPESLCDAIINVLDNYEDAKKKAVESLALAENYSWQKRAQNIIDFIKIQL